MKLISSAFANFKMSKNKSFDQYETYILHLAPASLSGNNVCPKASKGCRAACLNTAGRGIFNSVQQARIRKTKMFFENRLEFLNLLNKDLVAIERRALKNKKQAVVRLNGTSDLDWTLIRLTETTNKNVFESFPNIQFYDYTKVFSRLERQKQNPIENYDLTFSRSETNASEVIQALKAGFNVASVHRSRPINSINGDLHDLRFLDPKGQAGYIVALSAKGKAKRDTSGFVQD